MAKKISKVKSHTRKLPSGKIATVKQHFRRNIVGKKSKIQFETYEWISGELIDSKRLGTREFDILTFLDTTSYNSGDIIGSEFESEEDFYDEFISKHEKTIEDYTKFRSMNTMPVEEVQRLVNKGYVKQNSDGTLQITEKGKQKLYGYGDFTKTVDNKEYFLYRRYEPEKMNLPYNESLKSQAEEKGAFISFDDECYATILSRKDINGNIIYELWATEPSSRRLTNEEKLEKELGMNFRRFEGIDPTIIFSPISVVPSKKSAEQYLNVYDNPERKLTYTKKYGKYIIWEETNEEKIRNIGIDPKSIK